MKQTQHSGVALVITLIMLSLVTFLTVAFLSVARRERSSMVVTQSQTDSKNAADSGLAYAQSAALAQMFTLTNIHNYGMMISTNVDVAGGSPAALATLLNLPRAPVYVVTNAAFAPDFRFYLDFNRNGQYETNGGFPFYNGDPEWIGILDYPGVPHGPTNRFVGRFAYIILPASKSLDLNFIHNHAKTALGAGVDGFLRNQGFGSWEINLAAFLNELNSSTWPTYTYAGIGGSSAGIAFTDALDLLNYRYNGTFANLQTANAAFIPSAANLPLSSIDTYADGPLMLGGGFSGYGPGTQDNIGNPWPGGDNINASATKFYDALELLSTGRSYSATFMSRLTNTMNSASGSSNNYTFYTLLSQLGVDSEAPKHRMNLNYTNDFNATANSANGLVAWTPDGFFTNAADLMIKASISTNYVSLPVPTNYYYFAGNLIAVATGAGVAGITNLSVTNIPVYPFSLYTPEMHRLLQVAANIYDAANGNQFPSVFRPLFKNVGGVVTIVGYRYEPNASFIAGLTNLDMNIPGDQLLLSNAVAGAYHVRGVPIILGARKGFPNFNEFAMQTVLTATRKLQVTKPLSTNAFMAPNGTNQMIIYGISNRFFLEGWNSYAAPYSNALQMSVTHICAITLTNQFTNITNSFYTNTQVFNFAPNTWKGEMFQPIASNNVIFLPDSVFVGNTNTPQPLPYNQFQTNGFEVPQFGLSVSNWLRYVLIDTTSNRLVDYVNLGSLNDGLDLNSALTGISNRFAANSPGQFWLTNRFGGTNGPTLGILNQLKISTNALSPTNAFLWIAYNQGVGGGTNVNWEVGKLQQFMFGNNQFGFRYGNLGTTQQVPFSPTIKVYRDLSWEVNDPLVHYIASDLFRPSQTNQPPSVRPPRSPLPSPGTIGTNNIVYRPWGGNPKMTNVSYTLQDYDLSIKDPGIRKSDDWQFPNGAIANIGWLGQVHRGTPWQTIYLKSAVAKTNDWFNWSNTYETHPTNDWKLVGLFTTAINDNASRGLLSINQTNRAAWSAVLSGVQVLANNNVDVTIQPGSTQLVYIVDGINKIRSQMLPAPAGPGTFTNLGDILKVPHLTTSSPYIDYGVPLWDATVNYNNNSYAYYEGKVYYYYQTVASSNKPPDVNLTFWAPVNQVTPQMMNLTDFIYERIPMQTLSLLNLEEEPRLVIYSYGQSLKPADRSVQMSPLLGALRGIVTNYTVTGEVLIRSVVRVRNGPTLGSPGPFFPQIVVESYDILPSD
jgi:hypothetical protein